MIPNPNRTRAIDVRPLDEREEVEKLQRQVALLTEERDRAVVYLADVLAEHDKQKKRIANKTSEAINDAVRYVFNDEKTELPEETLTIAERNSFSMFVNRLYHIMRDPNITDGQKIGQMYQATRTVKTVLDNETVAP